MMKGKIFINLFSVVFFTCVLFFAVPIMAKEPLKNMQLYARGIVSDDAEAALDDDSHKNLQQEVTKPKQDDSPQNIQQEEKELKQGDSPQSLQQEVKELRQEVQKIRNEAEARKRLEVPEEEKGKSVEDILSAVGREYTMLKKGTIGLGYTFTYAYYSGDVISDSTFVEKRYNHNLTNTIDAEYALFNNLTISTAIPFAYKYNRVGTSSSQESTDLGDITLGLQVQPFKAGGQLPTAILGVGVVLPTGSSPYKIDPNNSLASGAGLYSINGGFTLSKVIDPLVAFGSLNYTYSFEQGDMTQKWGKTDILTKVDPGSSIGLTLGFGYALSYQASLNLSAQFTYNFNTKYTLNNITTTETGSSVSSTFNVGTGWRVTPSRSVYLGLGIGLTNNDPDFSFSIRVPFEF
jgi:polyhydroxyalkanoate synthesis regulator phasin